MSAKQPQSWSVFAVFMCAWLALAAAGCAEQAPVASLSLAGASADASADAADVSSNGGDDQGAGQRVPEDGGAVGSTDGAAADPDAAASLDADPGADIQQDAGDATAEPPDGTAASDAATAPDSEPADSAIAVDGGPSDSGPAGPGPDAGGPIDGGTVADAPLADAAPGGDLGPAVDTGPAVDAGPAVDTGPVADTGPAKDSGPAADAGIAVDAGPPADTATGPACGNGVCEPGESTQNCGSDCKGGDFSWTCGDAKCDIGEQFYCQKDCVKSPEQCVLEKCPAQVSACNKDAACTKAVNCALTCGNNWNCLQGCFPGGLSANPTASALLTCGQKAGCY